MSKRLAVLFDPDIDQAEIEAAMNAAGLMFRAREGVFLVDRVPGIVRRDPANDEERKP